MRQDEILLLADRPDRAERLSRAIALLTACRLVGRDGAAPSRRPAALVVDCAPDAPASQARLEAALAGIDPSTPWLYLSRGGGERESRFLARFAPPILVPAHGEAQGLVARLRGLLADEAAPTRRVARATALVGRLFAAAANHCPPAVEQVEQGCEIVLATVSEIGVRGFLEMVWAHDISVYQHSLGVAGYAAAFGTELGLSDADQRRLARAALLHDVGKARIPPAILNTPGPLDAEATAVMRTHAAVGADLLRAAGGFEPEIVDVARWHHERLDGSGYPDGLRGEAIADLVRLVSICDVHAALTERRVYRAPMPAAEAAQVMTGMTGQLDPDLLRAYRPILARGPDFH